VADDSFVLQRVKAVIDHLTKGLNDGSKKGKRTAFLIRKLADEALDEMCDVPPEMVEYYFTRSAAMMFWAATGMVVENLPMDPDFKMPPELCQHDEPTLTEAEREAWEAIETDDYRKALSEGRRREMLALEQRVLDES
jgi:hypothetical protein